MQLFRGSRVTNASLENRDFGVWTSYGNTSISSGSNAHAGDCAIKYTASTAASGAEQVIYGLTPNTAYRLTGWTKNGGKGLNIGVKNYGGADTSTNVASTAYAQGTVNFTTGPSNTTATIYAWRATSTADSYADDFFLSQPLAAPWSGQDVGSPALAGTSGRLGANWVVQASGGDIWSTADSFHLFTNR